MPTTIRLYAKNLSRRAIAVTCMVAGILAVRLSHGWETTSPSRIIVHVPLESGPTALDTLRDRDLSDYSLGGYVDECSGFVGKELHQCLEGRAKAREFIYDHWQSKEKAYITIGFMCIDCMPAVHVFVEPNEAGEWQILSVLEEARFEPMRWPDAFNLKYRRANSEERRRQESLTRVLSVLDREGNEIDSF